MPEIRPFRALRYDPEVVGNLGAVVAPPYDVIDAGLARELLARHPRNAVRLDLPVGEPGEEPDERYRRVARWLTAWRSDGTLRKDPRPSLYVYEQAYRVPGTDVERTQRGFFGRLRIEPFGPGSGVRPHERTLAGPREDRYRLLRATGVNTSPVVCLYEDPEGAGASRLAEAAGEEPLASITDADGTQHRLWAVADDGLPGGRVTALVGAAGAKPVVIADGHHRYETALRYRDERRVHHGGEPDPPFDFILALFLDAAGPLTVLPTHRVVRHLGEAGVAGLRAGLDGLFDLEPTTAEDLVAAFAGAGDRAGGEGRMGMLTREGAWRLVARRAAFAGLGQPGGTTLRGLDVSLLAAALELHADVDATTTGGDRIGYTKSAAEASELVRAAADGADVAFLLEPTPVPAILAVARDGDVMPSKSTYFHPKALTGLLLNPHEW